MFCTLYFANRIGTNIYIYIYIYIYIHIKNVDGMKKKETRFVCSEVC